MENLIFDYDGTLTDVEKSTEDWQNKYAVICSDMLGTSVEYMKTKIDEFSEYLKARPEKGFIIGGYDSVPAMADPYLRTQGAVLELINGAKKGQFDINIPEDDTKFLIDSYVAANKIANDKTYFREGLKDFLDDAKKKYNIVIVTNSGEEKVKKGLETLAHDNIPIFGNAKKLFVDNSTESLWDFIYDPKNYISKWQWRILS
jgi:FMN phosphatase YigB (HAD superfamily)